MRPTQRLQQWCCGRAWQLADFSLPPPPSLQQWIISPAEWGGGAAGGSFRVQGFLALFPLWQFPPSRWPVSARQSSAILCGSHAAHVTSGTLAKVNSFFWLSGPAASLMSRSCVCRHVTLKSWSLETWLHVFSLPFFRNPVICVFSHIIRIRFWHPRWLFCWELFKKLFDVGPSLHFIPCSTLREFDFRCGKQALTLCEWHLNASREMSKLCLISDGQMGKWIPLWIRQ